MLCPKRTNEGETVLKQVSIVQKLAASATVKYSSRVFLCRYIHREPILEKSVHRPHVPG